MPCLQAVVCALLPHNPHNLAIFSALVWVSEKWIILRISQAVKEHFLIVPINLWGYFGLNKPTNGRTSTCK